MSDSEQKPEPVRVDPALIDAAVRKATREAVLLHARLGQPVCTLRDGKVVWLSPEEVFALFVDGPGSPPQNGR